MKLPFCIVLAISSCVGTLCAMQHGNPDKPQAHHTWLLTPIENQSPDDVHDRAATARASLEKVKEYLARIQTNAHDPHEVQDLVSKAMKFVWNVEACLGEDPGKY